MPVRCREMLFASAAVLCEGKNDIWAVRSTIRKLAPNLDLNARSITVVNAGGSGGLEAYASISKQLGIRWCAITDEDKKSGELENTLTKAIRGRLQDLRGAPDELLFWPGNVLAVRAKRSLNGRPRILT